MKWILKTCRSLALLALLALSLLSPRFPQNRGAGGAAHAQEGTGPEYVVQSGDTLYGIAGRFGTSVDALQQANHIENAAAISVGQRLVIPGYEGLSGLLTAHELAPGETLDSLALRYGMSRAALVRFNRVLNPARMLVGQSVVFPQGGDGALAAATGRVLAGRAGGTQRPAGGARAALQCPGGGTDRAAGTGRAGRARPLSATALGPGTGWP
ncbi:MAG: LysM peptidoglycan-binding domain-containing protein [Chloroflexi bacterium]|nr:LysM peptidoglycan-binding domain-containing protein [Chloroflexota bacterium]